MTRNGSLPRLSRREWLTLAAAGISLGASSSWLQTLAADAARNPQRKRACILLWMAGGPSQMDTFDLKPGHANGGPFKQIATATPGIQISEHLPQIAKQMDRMVLVRSMSTKEGDHGRATFLLRTGYLPQGPIVGNRAVEDRAVSVPDFLATVCLALGIDFKKQNNSNVGRPIRIVDKAAKPITEVIA